jgi:4-amino-4-deoxy-L-arabinose transferase-like glycosyltransferase
MSKDHAAQYKPHSSLYTNTGIKNRILCLVEFFAATQIRAIALLILLSLAFFLPAISSLQPMDRDEPRFAQASKQMLESGDFIDIRFQGDSRYKKPVGIYWLQTASVAMAAKLGVVEAQKTILYYRIPSFLGALAAVLLTYWAALAFLPRSSALLSAALMSGCILLGVEARLAKTDAVLLTTVLITMGTLARVWFFATKPQSAAPLSQKNIIIFWISIGISLLIKGPITLMIAALSLAVLCYRERSARWLLVLRPRLGALIVVAIVLPWLALIIAKTGTAFFSEAVGKDMLGKVATGQERHGAPFGMYFGVFWITFWPVAPLVALATPYIFQNRKDDAVLFLLAWIIPSWLLFEAVPTKLPHYVLPLYPALAIAIMLAFENNALRVQKLWSRSIVFLIPLVPIVFLISVPVVFWVLDRTLPLLSMPFLALAVFLGLLAWREFIRNMMITGMCAALASSLALTIAAYPFGISQLRSINISKRLAESAQSIACAVPKIATTTYREPSLVFLTQTDLLLTDAAGAGQFMSEQGCRIAFIGSTVEKEFLKIMSQSGVTPRVINRVIGLNINSGKVVDIGVYAKVPQ